MKLFALITVATATKRSIIDTPVTISGFIIGMLVTDLTAPLNTLLRVWWRPRAAKVPISVAMVEERTARISEFLSAVNASSSAKSSSYQTNENPLNSLRLPASLKEKIISTAIGA